MMNLTEQEIRVFNSLADSGEGQVLFGYLERLERYLSDQLIDNANTRPEDIAGCRQNRAFIKTFKERFIHRATMGTEPEDLT